MKIFYKHIYSSDEKLKLLGNGEWIEEADEARFTYKNIKCEIRRIMNIPDFPFLNYSVDFYDPGHLCGYCNLSDNHPWLKLEKKYYETDSEVHGGITFFEGNKIGFDAGHAHDIIPAVEKNLRTHPESVKNIFPSCEEFIKTNPEKIRDCGFNKLFDRSYKNMDFMINECKKLAQEINLAQAAKLAFSERRSASK